MDKITFDFENGLISIENDVQKMTMTDEKLKDKKQSILESAGLETIEPKSFEREIMKFLRDEQLSRKSESVKKEKKKIAIKRVGEDIKFISTDATYRRDLKDLIVTKSFEPDILQNIYLNEDNTLVMIIDEDGIEKGYDLNILLETNSNMLPIQEICGNIVFARIKKLNIWEENIDYQIENLNEDDIALIMAIIERGEHLKYVLGK